MHVQERGNIVAKLRVMGVLEPPAQPDARVLLVILISIVHPVIGMGWAAYRDLHVPVLSMGDPVAQQIITSVAEAIWAVIHLVELVGQSVVAVVVAGEPVLPPEAAVFVRTSIDKAVRDTMIPEIIVPVVTIFNAA